MLRRSQTTPQEEQISKAWSLQLKKKKVAMFPHRVLPSEVAPQDQFKPVQMSWKHRLLQNVCAAVGQMKYWNESQVSSNESMSYCYSTGILTWLKFKRENPTGFSHAF